MDSDKHELILLAKSNEQYTKEFITEIDKIFFTISRATTSKLDKDKTLMQIEVLLGENELLRDGIRNILNKLTWQIEENDKMDIEIR